MKKTSSTQVATLSTKKEEKERKGERWRWLVARQSGGNGDEDYEEQSPEDHFTAVIKAMSLTWVVSLKYRVTF